MNLDIDQEQSDQSRRCEGATVAKHNCWDHAFDSETNQKTHDPLPELAESFLSKISSPCKDAPSRTDAATCLDDILQQAADVALERFEVPPMQQAFIEGVTFGITRTQDLVLKIVAK